MPDNRPILFTHDIDWITPLHPFGMLKKMTGRPWLKSGIMFHNKAFIRNIESLIAYEKSEHIQAIFLIGMQSAGYTYNRKGLRYAYDSPYLTELIELLKAHKVEIGLHINAFDDIPLQVTRFKKRTGAYPRYVRGHYFHPISYTDALYLKSVGVIVDLSVGNARTVGHLGVNLNWPLKQIPTILSDNNYVQIKNKVLVEEQFLDTIDTIKSHQLQGAVLFHPENLLIYPHLFDKYKEIVRYLKTVFNF